MRRVETISQVALKGKWVEVWVESKDSDDDERPFDECFKTGELYEAVVKADLEDYVTNYGHVGLGMLLDDEGRAGNTDLIGVYRRDVP